MAGEPGAGRGRGGGARRARGACVAAGLPLLLLALLTGGAAAIQEADLVSRIVERDDGAVRLTFGVREGVEICERGGMRFRSGWSVHRRGRRDGDCAPGPAVFRLELRDGALDDAELHAAGRAPGPAGGQRSLGRVGAAEAAGALLELARRPAPDRAAEEALLAAVVADSATVWPTLLEIARDADLSRDVRKAAVFWTGQIAARGAGEGLRRIVELEEGDLAVREAAVFSLSQLPTPRAVPALMEVARTAPHPRLRRSAFFWLAQADDPRVTDFFEEVLARGGRHWTPRGAHR